MGERNLKREVRRLGLWIAVIVGILFLAPVIAKCLGIF